MWVEEQPYAPLHQECWAYTVWRAAGKEKIPGVVKQGKLVNLVGTILLPLKPLCSWILVNDAQHNWASKEGKMVLSTFCAMVQSL